MKKLVMLMTLVSLTLVVAFAGEGHQKNPAKKAARVECKKENPNAEKKAIHACVRQKLAASKQAATTTATQVK